MTTVINEITLIEIFGGLLILIGVLSLLHILAYEEPKKPVITPKPQVDPFKVICEIIQNPLSTLKELTTAVDAVLSTHIHIENFEDYSPLLEKLCVHPNINSDVLLRFQRELSAMNPKHKLKIEEMLQKGLTRRPG